MYAIWWYNCSMIKEHYEKVLQTAGSSIQLCVVSKRRSTEDILSYYDAGERIFAENHADELLRKAAVLPDDIEWHFIGHLQRNKVKSILPAVTCIQSLDSRRLADEIEKQAARLGRAVDVLCEFHMASQDANKSGHDPADALPFTDYCMSLPHLNVCGIMAMGPHTDSTDEIRKVFLQTEELFRRLQEIYTPEVIHTLSMGMSSDYPIAAACGSTMFRIGSYLFEED